MRCRRLHLAILRSAAILVPGLERGEWLAEWKSELWYVANTSPRGEEKATAFCLGAFRDAFWLRRNRPRPDPRKRLRLESPLRCISFLAALAGAAISFALWLPCPCVTLVHLMVLFLALLLLPATTSLGLGEYPALAPKLRCWLFLAVKLALLVPTVYCGTFDLTAIVTSGQIQPHGLLVGYVLAFRWALIDQRQRCPVCLHLLASPARIGQPSHIFLAWYGTELVCPQGHGLLHVPEIPTSSYSTQRWLRLDPSWGSLFPPGAGRGLNS